MVIVIYEIIFRCDALKASIKCLSNLSLHGEDAQIVIIKP